MKCPECNGIIPDGSKFCNHCGAKITVANACPKCGATNLPADSKFCPDCGSKLATSFCVKKIRTNDSHQQNIANQKDSGYIGLSTREAAYRIVILNRKNYMDFADKNSLPIHLSALTYAQCQFIVNQRKIIENYRGQIIQIDKSLQLGDNGFTELSTRETAYRIILQNRNNYVDFAFRNSLPIHLSELTIEQCWLIIKRRKEIEHH